MDFDQLIAAGKSLGGQRKLEFDLRDNRERKT